MRRIEACPTTEPVAASANVNRARRSQELLATIIDVPGTRVSGRHLGGEEPGISVLDAVCGCNQDEYALAIS